MGYLAVVFAALCGAVKGYAGKKSSETLRSVPDALRFGALRTAAARCSARFCGCCAAISDRLVPRPPPLLFCRAFP